MASIYDQPYDPSSGSANPYEQYGPSTGGTGAWVKNPDGTWTAPDGTRYPATFTGEQPTPGYGASGSVAPQPTGLLGQPLTPSPSDTGGGGTGGGSGAGGGGGVPGPSDRFAPINMPPFQAPTPTPIGNAPAYPTPPPFSYGDFKAPSYADAMNDPGGKFAIGQGEDALSRFYAAGGQGDSATAYKGLIDYGRNAGNTLYDDIFNRDLTGYQTNRANAVDVYNTNYQTQYKDPYAPQLQSWQTNAQNTQFNNAQAQQSQWNSYLQEYLQRHNNQLDDWNRLFGTASLT